MGVFKRTHCSICKLLIDPNSERRSLCSEECVKKNEKRLWTKQNARQKSKGWPCRKRWLNSHRDQLLLTYARTSACLKGLEINITVEDIVIPGKCPVLGIPLFFTTGRRTDNTPTLDRIDNSKGYIKGNVVVVSWRVNNIKRDATIDELCSMARFYRRLAK